MRFILYLQKPAEISLHFLVGRGVLLATRTNCYRPTIRWYWHASLYNGSVIALTL